MSQTVRLKRVKDIRRVAFILLLLLLFSVGSNTNQFECYP